jgi:hypothetical protein
MPVTLVVRILEDIILLYWITADVIWAYGSTERRGVGRGLIATSCPPEKSGNNV